MDIQNIWRMITGGQEAVDQPVPVPATRYRVMKPQVMGPPAPPIAPPPNTDFEQPTENMITTQPDRMPGMEVSRGPASMPDVASRIRQLAGSTAPKAQIDPTEEEAINELMALQDQEAANQKKLVERAEGLQTGTDLSPMLALVDSWTGSKFAGNYKAPLQEPEKLALISKLRGEASGIQEKNLSTRLRKALGEGNLDAKGIAMMMGVNRQLDNAERKDEARDMKMDMFIAKYGRDLETDPMLKEMNKQSLSFGQVDQLLKKARAGNTTASAGLGIKMAKAMGEVGVMTEKDVTRYIESKKLSQKAGDKLKSWLEGRPTDATLDELEEIAGVMKGSMRAEMQPVYDRYAQRIMKNFGIPKAEAYERLAAPMELIEEEKPVIELTPEDIDAAKKDGSWPQIQKAIKQGRAKLPKGMK